MDFDPYHLDQPHLAHEPAGVPVGSSAQCSSTHDPRVDHKAHAIGWLVPSLIIGSCLAGVVVALGHHLLLQFLDGRNVANYSQFWVKNASNAFGNIVHWLLAASVTYSLMQMVWYYVRRSAFTLPDLDNIFGLPSPISASRLLISTWTITLLPVVMMAFITQATTLIAILAPNALEVGPAPMTQEIIAVPTLQFSSGMINSMESDAGCNYSGTTQLWQRTVQRAVISDRDATWSAPAECTVSCHYTVDYNAPALQCADLSPAQISDPSRPGTPPAQAMAILENQTSPILAGVFNATSNIGLSASDSLSSSSSPYTLTIAYQKVKDATVQNDAVGSFCTFYDATYRATVSFRNNTQSVSVAVLSYRNPVNNSYVAPSDCIEYGYNMEPPAGLAHSVNYHAISELFVQIFEGNVTSHLINNVRVPLVNTNVGLTNLFFVNQTTAHWSFTPAVANLSQSLADLLTNVSLAFMSSSTATANVSASVGSTSTIWMYDSRKLWTIYGLGFLVALVCGGIGMACLIANGSPGSRDFSQLLAATRNPRLDAVVVRQADLGGLNQPLRGNEKNIHLQYGRVGDWSSPSRMAFGVVGVDNIKPVKGREWR